MMRKPADAKRHSMLQEQLVDLYLRLNGFFTTGHIVHSSRHGNNLTEVDILALRMPFNADVEREVGTHDLLDLEGNKTDLLICEVKSRGQKVRFNDALTGKIEALQKLLRWAGCFSDVVGPAAELQSKLKAPLLPNAPPTLESSNIRVRAVLFFPETDGRRSNQPWFVCGREILAYVHACLHSDHQRPRCSTTYDLQPWGRHEEMVRYFKGRNDPGTITDLYVTLSEQKT